MQGAVSLPGSKIPAVVNVGFTCVCVCDYIYFILHFVLKFPFTMVREHLCQRQHLLINLFWDFFCRWHLPFLNL